MIHEKDAPEFMGKIRHYVRTSLFPEERNTDGVTEVIFAYEANSKDGGKTNEMKDAQSLFSNDPEIYTPGPRSTRITKQGFSARPGKLDEMEQKLQSLGYVKGQQSSQ